MREECNWYSIKNEDTAMINKVSYKIRRTLPGQSYDYEELYAEDTQSDTEHDRTPLEMMRGVIELCITNTARARLAKTEKQEEM